MSKPEAVGKLIARTVALLAVVALVALAVAVTDGDPLWLAVMLFPLGFIPVGVLLGLRAKRRQNRE